MSTKIYNGFRIPDSYDILEEIDSVRNAVDEVYAKESVVAIGEASLMIAAMGFKDAVSWITEDQVARPRKMSTLHWTAALLLEDLQEKLLLPGAKRVARAFDLTLEVAYLPGKFSDHHYALPFGNAKFIDAWRAHTGAEEYAYWDNTDEPEDVSEQEWQERKSNWLAALPPSTRPAERALSWRFYTQRPSIMYSLDKKAMDVSVIKKALADAAESGNEMVKSLIDKQGLDVFDQPFDTD